MSLRCPYCGKAVEIDSKAYRNVESYRNSIRVKTNCCNRLLWLSAEVVYRVSPVMSEQYDDVDDYGRKYSTSSTKNCPGYLGGRSK